MSSQLLLYACVPRGASKNFSQSQATMAGAGAAHADASLDEESLAELIAANEGFDRAVAQE